MNYIRADRSVIIRAAAAIASNLLDWQKQATSLLNHSLDNFHFVLVMQISPRNACIIVAVFLALLARHHFQTKSAAALTPSNDDNVSELDFCEAACQPPFSNSSAVECVDKTLQAGSKSRFSAACERIAGIAVLPGTCQRMCVCEQHCLKTFQDKYDQCMEKKSIVCSGTAIDTMRDCLYGCT